VLSSDAAIASVKVSSGKGFSIDGAAIFAIASMIGSESVSTLLPVISGLLSPSDSGIASGAFLRLL
jgi:hypothetical protein